MAADCRIIASSWSQGPELADFHECRLDSGTILRAGKSLRPKSIGEKVTDTICGEEVPRIRLTFCPETGAFCHAETFEKSKSWIEYD